jgi:hypothetical protein
MLTPREQGDFGERAALYWLVGKGAHVAIPLGHSPHFDLVAELNGQLLRVQGNGSSQPTVSREALQFTWAAPSTLNLRWTAEIRSRLMASLHRL